MLAILAILLIGSPALAPYASAQTFDRDALVAGAKREGALVLYTGLSPVAATKILKAFADKYPFIDVSNYYAAPAGQLEARMNAEKAAGKQIADVLHSGDLVQFHARQGELAAFATPEQDAYDAALKLPGLWTAYQVTTLGMAYNTQTLPEAEAPKSWSDLTDPKWSGQIGLENSTAGFMLIAWEALRAVMGADYWAKIAQNKPVFFGNNQPLMEGLLRGELLINANAGSYYIWQYAVLNGAPIKGILPQEGTPVAISPIAVLNTAPHRNAARLFVDWALSAEGQRVMVATLGSYSGRKDVPAPRGEPDLATIKTLFPDPAALARDSAAFVAEWAKYEKSN